MQILGYGNESGKVDIGRHRREERCERASYNYYLLLSGRIDGKIICDWRRVWDGEFSQLNGFGFVGWPMEDQVLDCRRLIHFLLILYRVGGWSNFSSTQILHSGFTYNGTCHCEQIATMLSSDFPVASSYICLVVSIILPLLSHFLPLLSHFLPLFSDFLPLERRVAGCPDILPVLVATISWLNTVLRGLLSKEQWTTRSKIEKAKKGTTDIDQTTDD